MSREKGFILPVALLLCLLVATVLAAAFAVAALEGRLAGSAAERLRDGARAEGAVWLGISLAARDLLADPREEEGFALAGPLPAALGEDPCPVELPAGSRRILTPLLGPETDLWIARRPPGRCLVTGRSGRGEVPLARTGHLEYLETTPLSYGLILDATGTEILPAIAVAGRAAVLRRDGGTTRFARLDLALPPPPSGPSVGWAGSPPPRELVLVGGALESSAGTPPTARAVAIGERLPGVPFRFPRDTSLPARLLVIRRDGEFPSPPLPLADRGGASLLDRLRASGLVLSGPPPWHGESPTGHLLLDGDRMELRGTVVIEGDLDLPAGTTYSGTGILAVAGDVRLRGDLLPDRSFPGDDALALLVAGEAVLAPDEPGGGTVCGILSCTTLSIADRWTVFGTVATGGIDGPAEASLSICPPPRGILPFTGSPLGGPPSWLLLEAGCRDPNVRWP